MIMIMIILAVILISISSGVGIYFATKKEYDDKSKGPGIHIDEILTGGPGCYINLSDCADSKNKQEYMITVGAFDRMEMASNSGYNTAQAHTSDQKCKDYMNSVHDWCGNSTQTKDYKYVSMPKQPGELTDAQALCYKNRYSKLTGDIPAVKEYWKKTGFELNDYPYCRNIRG